MKTLNLRALALIMKKLAYLASPILFISCLSSGNNNEEQKLEQIDKNSAREVVLTSEEKGDTIYHLTKQKIWSNNQLIAERVDTLKAVKGWNDTIKAPIYVTIQ